MWGQNAFKRSCARICANISNSIKIKYNILFIAVLRSTTRVSAERVCHQLSYAVWLSLLKFSYHYLSLVCHTFNAVIMNNELQNWFKVLQCASMQ